MDYCAQCRRHLNGALVCPGCGTPAAGPIPAAPHPAGRAPGGDRYYRAKPFPQEPPPHLAAPQAREPEPDTEPEPEPVADEADDPGGSPTDEASAHVPRGHRAAARASRGRGRRARPRHRVLGLVLAACLGTTLLGLTVSELGAPLPWSGPAVSPHSDGKPAGDAADAPAADPSDAAPAADTTAPTGPSRRPNATDSPTASDTPKAEPSTATPATKQPHPTTSGTAPAPTQSQQPDPPHHQPRCWLIFCS